MGSELYRNILIIDGEKNTAINSDVLIIDRSIQEISPHINQYPENTQIISANQLILGDGLVDLYSHSGEPGYEERETIISLLKSAQSGGFSWVNILPDTLPILDQSATIVNVQQKYQKIAAQYQTKLSFWGALTKDIKGEQMSEIAELTSTNISGFCDGEPTNNPSLLSRLLEYLQPNNLPIFLWGYDRHLARNGIVRDGIQSIRFGLPGDPVMSETSAIAAILEMVANLGTPLHLMRVSTQRGVELIERAKQQGLPITASTTWLHLIANTEDLKDYNPNFRLDPPLGNPEDQKALIQGLKTGVLEAIAIDHTPYTYEEKTVAFGEAPTGAIGLQLALPLLWSNLVVTEQLSPIELWSALSTKPAKLLNQSIADQKIIFDPNYPVEITQNNLKSLSHNTSWYGQEIQGKVLGFVTK